MTNQELFKLLIEQQFIIIGRPDVKYEDVAGTGKYSNIEGIPWYQYFQYTTDEQFQTWKKFCIKNIKKYLRLKEASAENEFIWLNLSYGLKQTY